METLLTLLTAPFVAFWFLVTTSWWSAIIFLGFFSTSIFKVHDKKSSDIEAAFIFVLAISGAIFAGKYVGTENGFWESIKLTGVSLFFGLKYYSIWGLVSVAVLWIFEALEFRRKYRDAKNLFENKTQTEGIIADESARNRIWNNCMREVDLYSDKPLDASTKEGVSTISSFFFLWPLHMIDRCLGEVIRQIPEFISMVFGRLFNSITKFITGGSSGRPDKNS